MVAWRQATVFTEAERAALELAGQGTRTAGRSRRLTDKAWAEAAKRYDEEQFAAPISLIGVINACNRIKVVIQQPAGERLPGPVSSADFAPPRQPRVPKTGCHTSGTHQVQ
ncbi:carboxymuconolactone decarboxylase family protein [Streptomyces sp. NPDC086010]|uniref:carboxymuconolactone decarboxylase family protein n=1 Tax=Streptomyces sp. NPDC086010 TaxID=3365745 RepID=UPI0037D73339